MINEWYTGVKNIGVNNFNVNTLKCVLKIYNNEEFEINMAVNASNKCYKIHA